VTAASAGHNPAIVLSPGKPPRQAFAATGRVLGMMPANPVTSESMDLAPGDTLLFFSDGVDEAFNEAEEMLGVERVLAHLAERPEATAAETVASLLALVQAHAGRAKQSDDISILASRWSPP
jgi:sigma-B regulation protein RsbU (phosphoserine phosphatase)